MPTKKGGNDIREKFINEQLTKEKKLSLWLWIGVGGLATVIIFFWGFSLWSNLTTFNWRKTEENKILTQSSSEWNKAFKEAKQNQLKDQISKEKIKELLDKVLKQSTTTTTNTTSTLEISTTTTSTVFSTTTLSTTSKR